MTLHYREATFKDIESMSIVRNSVKENKLSDPNKITRNMYLEHIQTNGKTWVCEEDGRLVGFSSVNAINGSIWALFLLEDYEGNGIGKTLLNMATHFLFSKGHKTINLTTEKDTRAMSFYEMQGWKQGDIKNGEISFTLHK